MQMAALHEVPMANNIWSVLASTVHMSLSHSRPWQRGMLQGADSRDEKEARTRATGRSLTQLGHGQAGVPESEMLHAPYTIVPLLLATSAGAASSGEPAGHACGQIQFALPTAGRKEARPYPSGLHAVCTCTNHLLSCRPDVLLVTWHAGGQNRCLRLGFACCLLLASQTDDGMWSPHQLPPMDKHSEQAQRIKK